ncbi:MAG TPA: ATP-binding protein [Feifaniaceae bacterium]|nr:ATP-binding protein [Feifaniaceae bacterium]
MGAAFVQVFRVAHGEFDTAGEASSKIKAVLKKLGISPAVVRDVAIAAFESEMNLIIHSVGGTISLEVTPQEVILVSEDSGPGIADIALALTEGYSTAPESVRNLGFGAGMGLPNIRRHSHFFHIESELGKGTRIEAKYYLNGASGTM